MEKQKFEEEFENIFDVGIKYHRTAKAILKKQKRVSTLQIFYIREYLRFCGIWLDECTIKWRFYEKYSTMMYIIWNCVVIPLGIGLLYAKGDMIRFCQNFAMFAGVTACYSKFKFHRKYANKVNGIFEHLSHLHEQSERLNNVEIWEIQRFYFLWEYVGSSIFMILTFGLASAENLTPMFSDEDYPLAMKFPFDLENIEKHPNWRIPIYLYNILTMYYCHMNILHCENIATHILLQISCLLDILNVKIKALSKYSKDHKELNNAFRECVEFHQEIINLVDKINETYYDYFATQIFFSTTVICFSLFRIMFSLDKSPAVAVRALTHFLTVLGQVLYWCLMGNMVYFKSVETAVIAFEIEEWWTFPQSIRKNLMFFIMRAQKPLILEAKPLPAFVIGTLTALLKMSYSYFTLLRDVLTK